METLKTCTHCHKAQFKAAYYKQAKAADGYASQCKTCIKAKHGAGGGGATARPTAPAFEPAPQAPAPTPLPPLEAAETAYRTSREKRSLKAEHGALLEENERLRAIINEVQALHPSAPLRMTPPPQPEKGEAVPLLTLSDWHWEERVDLAKMHGVNEYSLEIAGQRCRKYFENSLRLIALTARDSLVRRVVVGLQGDFISNSIHLELLETNEVPPGIAAQLVKDALMQGIQYWLDNSDLEFDFYCVGGNHGRMTEKTRISTNAENSLEIFMYKFLASEFKGNARVRFHVAVGDMMYADIFPHFRVRFIHGDQISFGGGIGGLTIPLNKWISRQDQAIRADLTTLGHFHQMLDGGRFLVNGSLIGASPYSQRFGFSPEPPAQQFALIHSRNGGCKSIVAPVWCAP